MAPFVKQVNLVNPSSLTFFIMLPCRKMFPLECLFHGGNENQALTSIMQKSPFHLLHYRCLFICNKCTCNNFLWLNVYLKQHLWLQATSLELCHLIDLHDLIVFCGPVRSIIPGVPQTMYTFWVQLNVAHLNHLIKYIISPMWAESDVQRRKTKKTEEHGWPGLGMGTTSSKSSNIWFQSTLL